MQNSKSQLKLQNFLVLAVLFLLPAYLIKIKFGWVSLNILELLVGVLFLLWIFKKDTKNQIPKTKYWLPTGLIFIGLLLSVVANKNYYSGLGAIKGWFLFPIIFAVVFYDLMKKDESLLKKSFSALFFSGAVVSLIGVACKILGVVTYDGRLEIFWDSPNQLAMFLAPAFLIGVSGLIWEIGKIKEWKMLIKLFFLLLITLNIYLTHSFGAWLAIVLTLIIIFWLVHSKIWQKKYLALLLTILLILLGWASFGKFENIKNLGSRSSFASRIAIWKSAGLMIKNNPLLGIGPGNFQNKYLEYQKYFSPYLEWSAPQPHNLFLAFWLESGLAGLAGFIWLLIIFFRDNKKVYPFTKISKYKNVPIREIKKQTSNNLAVKGNFGDGAIHDLRILLLVIMIYILIHGLVDTTYWRNDLAVIFWAIIAANIYLMERK